MRADDVAQVRAAGKFSEYKSMPSEFQEGTSGGSWGILNHFLFHSAGTQFTLHLQFSSCVVSCFLFWIAPLKNNKVISLPTNQLDALGLEARGKPQMLPVLLSFRHHILMLVGWTQASCCQSTFSS